MVGMVIALLIISPIVGFLTVYQWFNLRGLIPCIYRDNLNRVAVAVEE